MANSMKVPVRCGSGSGSGGNIWLANSVIPSRSRGCRRMDPSLTHRANLSDFLRELSRYKGLQGKLKYRARGDFYSFYPLGEVKHDNLYRWSPNGKSLIY